MAYTEEELAGLTDEERAALEDEETGLSPDEISDTPDDDGNDEGYDADEQDRIDAENDAAVKAAATPATAPVEEEAPIPVYVAEPPADADAKLSELAEKKSALAELLDDGEITGKEYHAQYEALSKEERTIEREVQKAQISAEMEEQRITNERNATIGSFLAEVEIPWDTKHPAFAAFNTLVIKVANEPENAALSTKQILDKAYEGYREVFGGKKAPAEKQDKQDIPRKEKPRAEFPPTLAKLPASDITDTDEANKFAYLDRMDPVRREEAMSKMSEADRETYLRYA